MFDLKMKKTEGMCSPHTVSNGFSLQAEWILAELKIGGFLNRLETVAREVRRGPGGAAGRSPATLGHEGARCCAWNINTYAAARLGERLTAGGVKNWPNHRLAKTTGRAHSVTQTC